MKAALIDHSGPEPELKQFAYLPLVTDAIVEGEIMDAGLVSDTVRGVIQTLGVPVKRVVTAVGGRDVIVKKIQMDRMPADDAREAIHWEAEQHVPFDMSNVQLDFQILDPDQDGLQMSVLLVAAKRELVDQKMLLLQEAGLTAAIVDVDAFALHNAFEFNYASALRGINALVNVGNEISTVIMQQDGVPVLTRDIPFGARHLREDLKRTRGLTHEEAEAVIQGHSDRVGDVGDLIVERCQDLAIGIERAAAFLSMEDASNKGLGAIYLAGGGARIPRLADAISNRLHVRIEIANPLQQLRADPNAVTHGPVDEIAPMMMLPIGLALRRAA